MKNLNKLLIGLLLVIVNSSACAGSGATDYKMLLESLPTSADLDRCVRGWSSIDASHARADVRERYDALKFEKTAILLEICNSGFARYDYTLIVDDVMTTGGGAPKKIGKTRLGAVLRGELKESFRGLQSEVQGNVDDGDCFFLTVRTSRFRKVAAFYGDSIKFQYPLIRELLLSSDKSRNQGVIELGKGNARQRVVK